MEFIKANDAQIAAKVMEGEAILINLTTGIYYSLDDVASEMWEAIVVGTSASALGNWASSTYGVDQAQAAADVAGFVQALQAEEIVVAAEEGAAVPNAGSSEYAPPSFERFDDMAEMFALDPPLPGLAQND